MLSDVRAVACVGAGTVGSSWAVVFARAGLEVRVYDADPAQLARLAEREECLRAGDGDRGAARPPLRGVTDLAAALKGVAYVQESVPEQLAVKQAVFAELDRLTAPDVVLASSASALPMSRVAAGLTHPERCLVVHPLNPPHALPLVEVVPGERTAPAVAEAVRAFMERIGQTPILLRKEIFGFVANRVQMALLREALYLHREGVASAADIDRCVSEGLGLCWALLGPFGVEHTNAASIAEDLCRFGEPIRELFAALYSGADLLTDHEIDALSAEVETLFADREHDELLRWRDSKILALRQAKST